MLRAVIAIALLLAILPVGAVWASPPDLSGHTRAGVTAEETCSDQTHVRVEIWTHPDESVPDFYVITKNGHIVAAKPYGPSGRAGWYIFSLDRVVPYEELAKLFPTPCDLPLVVKN